MAYGDQQKAVKNYAESEEVRARVKKEIIPLMDECRQSRSQLNFDWARYHKAWSKEHEFQAYQGKSNIYIPATKKVVETLVAQTVAATFPGDEFFAVEPERDEYGAMAADVQVLEQNRAEDAKIRQHAEAYYRQLFMKGNSPARIHWKSKNYSTVKRKKAVEKEDELYGLLKKPELAVGYEGPCFTPIPVENFYAWPATANSLEDADGVFEDFTSTKRDLMRKAAQGVYVKSECEAAGSAVNPEKEMADQARLASQGISPPQAEQTTVKYVDCSHVFCEFDPDAKEEEAEKNPRPFCITVTKDGKVLRVVEAHYTSPGACHPYVLGRLGQIVGRLWGSGTVEDIYPLQLLLNDQVNQAMDIATWVLNPGIVSNPNVLMTAVTEFEPGFQVLATDINNALKEFRPPQEMIQSSAVLMTQTQSWLNDFGMAPPVLQGGSAPGRAFRTATGIGTAQKNAETPLQQIVRSQETDTWQPTMKRFWGLDQVFAKDPVVISAGGPFALAAKKTINPMSLYGDYRFRWNASTQLMNVQVRGQQIMQALQVLGNPQTMQALMQFGVRVNLMPLIQRLLRDVFGFRDTDKILVQSPQQPPMPGMPPPQPGAEPQQPVQDPGSLNGAQPGLDPSGAFGAVRQEANLLAAGEGENNLPGEEEEPDPFLS
jgi:hypothetical protein